MSDPAATLEKAERAYIAGDYRTARNLAHELVTGDSPEGVRKRAQSILDATRTDPWVIAAFLLTFGVLVFFIFRYVL
ncbi:MAG: hypothetical protein PHU25_01820 [Deltaproteobacteria bacterium]|nr:hypothetical protein [Deltaproteobacteria bacterium]